MPTRDGSGAPHVHRRVYAKPPIIERVAEVHVIPGQTSLATAKEALTPRWLDYPHLVQQPFGSVEMKFDLMRRDVQTSQHEDTRLQFWRQDRRRLLQASKELFVANDLLPQPGWDELKPMFVRGFTDYLEVFHPRSIVKAVLRYLNRVPVPSGLTAEELFAICPKLPDDRQRDPAPFQMIVDMGDKGVGPAVLVLAFSRTEAGPAYALDLVVESGAAPLPGVEAVEKWLEAAHERMTELFESSITDRARLLFKEEAK